MKMPRRFLAVIAAGILWLDLGCRLPEPRSPQDSWHSWLSMELPVKIASSRVSKRSSKLFDAFAKAAQQGDYPRAIAQLDNLPHNTAARAWSVILRGQLAGLHTQACAQGQWLELRASKKARPARLSMLEILDGLEPLAASPDKILARQAEIAQARILVIARDCPGARTVQQRAREKLRTTLSHLSRDMGDSLPPDLCFLWANEELEGGKPARASKWLDRARAQGLDDPRIDLATAQAAFEEKRFKDAERFAAKGAKRLNKRHPELRAQAWSLAARSSWARSCHDSTRNYLARAQSAQAYHPSLLAMQSLLASQAPERCSEELASKLAPLWELPWKEAPTLIWALDELMREADRDGPNSLRCLASALVWDIDTCPEPALRGTRYFYAATLDTRLGLVQSALGRAIVARTEFDSAGAAHPRLPVQELIDALESELGGSEPY